MSGTADHYLPHFSSRLIVRLYRGSMVKSESLYRNLAFMKAGVWEQLRGCCAVKRHRLQLTKLDTTVELL